LNANRLARELSENQQRLSLATQAANLGVWEWDVSRDEIWVTEAIRERLGLGEGERPGLDRFLQSLHADDRAATRQIVRRALEAGSGFKAEYRSITVSGDLRWIAASGVVERGASGKALRMRGVSVDITERKWAEIALRESEARFRSLADTAPVMIWMSGTDQLCTYFNKGWLDFTGRSLEQELGNGWVEGVHPDDYQHCLKTYTTAFDARRTFIMQYRLRKQGGQYGWVLDTGVPRFAADRMFLGYIGTCIDITAQRKTEADLHRQRSELAHMQRVLTMGELSGSIAHELNQPLGIILSNAQAAQELLDQKPPAATEVHEILSDIVAADRRAAEIIQRMRGLLKRGEISPEPLSLNHLIEEVLQLLRADLIERGVTAHADLAPDLPPVLGGRVQLQQVLLNLILNAVDSMADNAPDTRRLWLATFRLQNRVHAAVRDEGHGLPADVGRLFQPFYTTKPHGLGMGLSICRSIIDAHDGRIWADPHPERGAVFHFELPVAGSPEKA